MKKLRWHYDKKFRQWYTLESEPFVNDSFTIDKSETTYHLKQNHQHVKHFTKLKNAKQCARLLAYG